MNCITKYSNPDKFTEPHSLHKCHPTDTQTTEFASNAFFSISAALMTIITNLYNTVISREHCCMMKLANVTALEIISIVPWLFAFAETILRFALLIITLPLYCWDSSLTELIWLTCPFSAVQIINIPICMGKMLLSSGEVYAFRNGEEMLCYTD